MSVCRSAHNRTASSAYREGFFYTDLPKWVGVVLYSISRQPTFETFSVFVLNRFCVVLKTHLHRGGKAPSTRTGFMSAEHHVQDLTKCFLFFYLNDDIKK